MPDTLGDVLHPLQSLQGRALTIGELQANSSVARDAENVLRREAVSEWHVARFVRPRLLIH